MALAQPGKHLVNPFDIPWFFGRALALPRDDQVFPNRERGKNPTPLRYETDPEARNAFGAEPFDGFSEQPDFAAPGVQKTDDRRNAGRLSRSVAAQQRHPAARPQ